MFEHIRRICRVTTLPVFADADTGYGGVHDAQRTIALWEEAGASVLHLEDQAMPKKCGHFAGKQLVPAEEMRRKLRAMLEARRDPDFFIVARTDAVAVSGLDDAIRRLQSYAEVGADGLYVDAPESVEQLKEISRRLKPLGKPLLFNMARSGKSPYLSLKDVYDLGFDYALCPIEPLFAMHKAVKEMMEIFMREGSTNAIADRLTRSTNSTGSSACRKSSSATSASRPEESSSRDGRIRLATRSNPHGSIVVLTLKRPASGNRITARMAVEITAALDATRRDPQIGGCVMTGHGDVFCLGGDYRGAGPSTEERAAYAQALIGMDEAMSRLGKPLVAAVNGDAHAGGFGIVVGCDLAIAADDATLGLPEAAHGLFPFIAQAIVRDALPKKLLFDIVYNARLMDAQEALRCTLSTKPCRALPSSTGR
jgi:methylisocitrate lyase